jgi:hypothetical protein
MAKRKRRVFTDEFKADAVRLCKAGGRSIGVQCWGVGTITLSESVWKAATRADRACCWGGNEHGEAWDATWLGFGSLELAATDLAMTESYACALHDGGALCCWGNVGGPNGVQDVPGTQPLVLDRTRDLIQIAGGDVRLCASIETAR